jgi:hypothetical protein
MATNEQVREESQADVSLATVRPRTLKTTVAAATQANSV